MPKKINGQCAEVLLIEDNVGDAILTQEALLESKTRISLQSCGMEKRHSRFSKGRATMVTPRAPI